MKPFVCCCQYEPCACPQPPRPVTYCDMDRRNNVWVEGVQDENGTGGCCLLDVMTWNQVIGVDQTDERARADLLKVTSNPDLIHLAQTLPPLPKENEGDKLQIEMNRQKDTIPFYALFAGNPPFAQ